MYTILLVIHTILVLFLIGVILLQRSDDSGMGSLGGGGNNALLSGRAAGSLLTRITAILATLFILSSLVLGVISSRSGSGSIVDTVPAISAPAEEGGAPAVPTAEKVAPSVPKPE